MYYKEHSFEKFMEEVNAHTISVCGMSTSDLDDYHYHDCYDDGMDPEECAMDAMENAGGDF